jgi:hypothetical protein
MQSFDFFHMFCSLGGLHAISKNSICYDVFFKYIRDLGRHFPPAILSGSDGCTTSHLDDALLASTFGCLLLATPISGGVQFEPCLILDLSAFGYFCYCRAASSLAASFFPFSAIILAVLFWLSVGLQAAVGSLTT